MSVPTTQPITEPTETKSRPPVSDWLLWQLADSAFPSGGFAHSGGLEAAWQQGEVRSRDMLTGFIQHSLTQLGRSVLPFISESHMAPHRLKEIDALNDAFLSNHVTNRASRLQGRAFITAAERSFVSPALTQLRSELLSLEQPCHVAPVFGVVLRLLEVERAMALRQFVFITLRSYIASAVRLNIIGPMEGQAMQFRLTPHAEEVCRRYAHLGLDDISQTAPILDILQGAHDRLYSRLFQT